MATFDYSRMVRTANRLIARFGQSAAIRRTTVDMSDPLEPGDPVTTDHACTAVVTDYTMQERAGTLIKATDRKIIVSTAGVTITPKISDKLVVGDEVYSLVTIDPLNPGGTLLLWQMQARR